MKCSTLGAYGVLFLKRANDLIFLQRTLSVIKTLLLFTVNRGALIAVTQVGHLISYLASTVGVYWYAILCRLTLVCNPQVHLP